MSNIVTTKYFTDFFGPDVYLINNIRFVDTNKNDAINSINKVDIETLKEYADGIDYDTNAEYTLSYVRTMLMYNTIEVLFDYNYVSEFAGNSTYENILYKHEYETQQQPWNANYTELSGEVKITNSDKYKLQAPEDWYAVFPASTIEYILDDKVKKEVLEQLLYEYLLNTLPITIVE